MPDENEGFPLALASPAKPYRMLHLFSVYGKWISYLVSGTVLLACFMLWWQGYGIVWVPVGAALAAFALLLLSCFAELVDLIVDTMVPK